jgi:carbamoyltransferase
MQEQLPTGPILGISPLDKDATAALYIDGTWQVIAEERLSRIKLHAGFPRRAIQALLTNAGIRAEQIDHVVYPYMPWWTEGRRIAHGYLRDIFFTLSNGTPVTSRFRHLIAYARWCSNAVRNHEKYHRELLRELRPLKLDHKLTRIEHHAAHAASAYLTSGFDEAIAVTLDWYGGGLSGSVNLCTPAGINRLLGLHYPHSLGLFYAQVTCALGFKMSQDEGKVVGLAAYGDSSKLASVLLQRLVSSNGDFRFRSGMDPTFARDLAAGFPREHVAAAYQHAIEVVACDITAHWIEKTGIQNIVLAGGVAANVKMNQRIAELKGVRRVFIHPNMGDGGAGIGAILAFLLERGRAKTREWETCYLGPQYTHAEMEAAVRRTGMEPVLSTNVAKDVAKFLASGKVVARFDGRLEYGPRALGNRSILFFASDPNVNYWLNKRLGRTEFMPFGPVTLYEHRRERYHDVDKCLPSARFMTITCQCTELMKREAPAAVHVDGTARPQIIRREDNPLLYAILEEYYKLTGVPTLINTSFNMHEEPIVCSPDDASRAFVAADLDYLSIGPFLVARNHKVKPLGSKTRSAGFVANREWVTAAPNQVF